MKPEQINKLGDVFKFLGEQQAKLEKIADSIHLPKEEVCENCGKISNECDCDNEFNKL